MACGLTVGWLDIGDFWRQSKCLISRCLRVVRVFGHYARHLRAVCLTRARLLGAERSQVREMGPLSTNGFGGNLVGSLAEVTPCSQRWLTARLQSPITLVFLLRDPTNTVVHSNNAIRGDFALEWTARIRRLRVRNQSFSCSARRASSR